MEKIALNVTSRSETGKAARRASDGRIPAVVYGDKVSTRNVWVDALAFERLFATAGTNTILSLTVDNKTPLNVLIYEYQTDPITNRFSHVDFYAVNMKEEVETEVPLMFVGVAPAVKELGGTLVRTIDDVTVRALPTDLPREITVDLSCLKTFDDRITVGDLPISDKVEVLAEKDTVVAMVDEPRSEEELAALDEAVDADVSKVEDAVEKPAPDAADVAAEDAEKK